MLLPLLIGAGFWQLQRAAEKHTLQELLAEQQHLPPLQWPEPGNPAHDPAYLYRQVTVEGHFVPEQMWLIENKIHHGQVGYEVVAPFYLADGAVLLVNRGWFEGTGYREQLPMVPAPNDVQQVTGRLTTPSTNTLLQQQLPPGNWPQTALQVDIEQMQRSISAPISPWILQIAPDHSAALTTAWQNTNMPASKHLGYAWQWFTMALALIVLTIFANSNLGQLISRTKKSEDE